MMHPSQPTRMDKQMNPNLTEKDRALAIDFAGPEPFEPAANEPPPLREFVIRIKRGDVTRLTMSVMAVDSLAAAEQHSCRCETGEYVSAMPAERYRARAGI